MNFLKLLDDIFLKPSREEQRQIEESIEEYKKELAKEKAEEREEQIKIIAEGVRRGMQ